MADHEWDDAAYRLRKYQEAMSDPIITYTQLEYGPATVGWWHQNEYIRGTIDEFRKANPDNGNGGYMIIECEPLNFGVNTQPGAGGCSGEGSVLINYRTVRPVDDAETVMVHL